MNGFGAGLEPDTVAPALADNLRLCQLQVTGCRHDDPVALAAYVLQRATDVLIVGLDAPHFCQKRDELPVTAQRNARLLADDAVVQRAWK